jgi:hypothetical protein
VSSHVSGIFEDSKGLYERKWVDVGRCGEGGPEDFDILACAVVPAEVHAHAARDHLVPLLLVVSERVDRIVESRLCRDMSEGSVPQYLLGLMLCLYSTCMQRKAQGFRTHLSPQTADP